MFRSHRPPLAGLLVVLVIIAQALAAPPLSVSGKYKEIHSNELFQAYTDMSPDVFEVSTFGDLSARSLMKYGVISVLGSKSIITSDLLSEEALNPNYVPSFDTSRTDAFFDMDGININIRALKEEDDTVNTTLTRRMIFHGSDDKRRNMYTEVDYSDAEYAREVGNYVPISGCYKNDKSDTKSSFSQSWSVSVGSGASASVLFSQLFGFSPSFGIDFTFGYSTGGSLSCDVAPGKLLQFQAKVETVTISNLRQRPLKINRDFKYTAGVFAKMDVGEWQSVASFAQLNKFNVQLACVTDPELLMC